MLSNTVATALQLTGKDKVEETAQFVKMFHKFFDSLNVTDLVSGRRARNAKGNCRGNKATGETELDMKENTPLPKKNTNRRKPPPEMFNCCKSMYVHASLCFSKMLFSWKNIRIK